jgi:hypothetical protein
MRHRHGVGATLRKLKRHFRNLHQQLENLTAEIVAVTAERDALWARIETEGRLPACGCGSLTPEDWCRRCGRQLG